MNSSINFVPLYAKGSCGETPSGCCLAYSAAIEGMHKIRPQSGPQECCAFLGIVSSPILASFLVNESTKFEVKQNKSIVT